MLFELREYHTKPGQRDRWIQFMDEVIIPFQTSKGMVIVATFVGEQEDDLSIWTRRFHSEEQRERLYAEVYQSDYWRNGVSPLVGDMIDRSKTVVTRLNPTPHSVIR